MAALGERKRTRLHGKCDVIFVTVGTDLPFDRLVRVVDDWAAATGRDDVFAQIGKAARCPRHIAFSRFLEPVEYRRRLTEASSLVSHAGMGTILTALQYRKPVLVMPRRAALGEQRNDHQLATARRLAALGKVRVAFDENELRTQLAQFDELSAPAAIGAYAQAELLAAIRGFIHRAPCGSCPKLFGK
jgi:UDP-N-acetylglucosamine transferase subunit ALG13